MNEFCKYTHWLQLLIRDRFVCSHIAATFLLFLSIALFLCLSLFLSIICRQEWDEKIPINKSGHRCDYFTYVRIWFLFFFAAICYFHSKHLNIIIAFVSIFYLFTFCVHSILSCSFSTLFAIPLSISLCAVLELSVLTHKHTHALVCARTFCTHNFVYVLFFSFVFCAF